MLKVGLSLIVFAAMLSSTLAENKNSVRITDYVDLTPGHIKLHDLIESSNIEPSLKDVLSEVELGAVPEAGQTLSLSQTTVSQAISNHLNYVQDKELKEQLKQIQFVIPRVVKIQGAGWESSIERLHNYLSKNLRKHCQTECDVVVEQIQAPHFKAHYKKTTRFQLDEFKSLPRGAFSQKAKVFDENINENIWVNGKIKVLQLSPVAKKLLSPGWRLQEDDFELKKVDVTMESDTIPALDKIVGSKLHRALRPGQVILNSALVREQDVVFGQTVKVIIKQETWHVTTNGIARDAGSIGDRIKVFNPDSKKMVTGILVAKGVVEIQ